MEIDELKGVWFVKICGFLKFEDLRKSHFSPQRRLSTGTFVFQIKSQDVCVKKIIQIIQMIYLRA